MVVQDVRDGDREKEKLQNKRDTEKRIEDSQHDRH